MRRAAIWAGVLALAAVAAGGARWPVAPGRVADSLNAAVGPLRPLTWGAPQAATFSALPWPSLHIVDATLDNASGVNLISAPEADVELSALALLSGRIAPVRVTLGAPTITFDLDRPPFSGRFGASDAMAAVNGFAPLGGVSLTNGVVRVTSRARDLDTVIETVNGRFENLSSASQITVDLSAIWRDAPFILSVSLSEPQSATTGRPSALDVRFKSSLGNLNFDGTVTAGATPGAAGDLSASSHAVAEVLRLVGVKSPPFPGLADFAVSGKVKATSDTVAFDEATITGDGQTLQGALRVARNRGRFAVAGSLDADRLSLAPLLGSPTPWMAPDGGWSAKALSLSPPRDFDLDLRLSADELDAYGVRFSNIAASAMIKDGALTASLVDATAYEGRMTGELRLACDASRALLSARGRLAGADFGAAFTVLGWPSATGRGDAEFSVETAGRAPADLIAGLSGKASISLTDGAISGVNLEGALRRSQRRSIEAAKDLPGGGTAFERATLDLLIGQGVAHVVEGSLVARGVSANLQGAVDLGGQSWKLRLNASQADPSGAVTPDAARLSLDIDGPWSAPSVQAVQEGDGAGSAP